MNQALYSSSADCPICEKNFPVLKVRSRLTTVQKHSDFYTEYKEINPNVYLVWACPHCGYAAAEHSFTNLMDRQVEVLRKELLGKMVKLNLCGERTLDQAVISFKLAIYFTELIGAHNSAVAGLFLNLAWLYRGLDEKQEQRFMKYAVEHYEKAFASERFPIGGKMSEVTLKYLVGEIYRRIGDLEQAQVWLGRTIHDRQAKMEPNILNMARDAWEQLKEQSAAGEAEEQTQTAT